MANSVYRDKVVDRLSSPERINDYLHVTNPSVWVALVAIILLLAGALIWSSTATIYSYALGSAVVEDGKMIITFDDAEFARNVEAGMSVEVGSNRSEVMSIGAQEDGTIFAHAETTLADGIYPARVSYRQTQLMKLLFN